ncbi:type II secretion system minor pseudopilin GspI [Luminiphilus sp.]|nr:type II secretion system minor pseudopilin GspI [Luminiphilus sp.]MDA8986043.1 type II secretion system minor pseudopilin GspI [Luminiphilus sp.]MDB2642884.1 type II secretion system minor pseudopilin GspI [Luminiphilus sp.]
MRSNRSSRPSSDRAFTLVEVMVALAVVSVAVPALLLALSQQLDGTRYLQDRIQAQWVAANRLVELRLVSAAKGTLQTGLITGSEEMAGRIWYWWSEGEETQVPGFFRYEVTVSDSEDGFSTPLHTLDGYLMVAQANRGR